MLAAAFSLRQGNFQLEVDFTSKGGVTALFGASGSGKTTVIRAIAGLATPHSGLIRMGTRTLFDAAAGRNLAVHRRNLGVVFQDSRLFPHLSVHGNITYGAWAGGRRRGRLDEIIDLLGLGALLERRPGALSGGERQRIAIARALYSSPDALLMDEPLASLDAPRKAEILPYLDRLKREARLPILYVSHALEEVTRLADDLVLLDRGRQIAAGPIATLLQRSDLAPIFGTMDAGSLIEARVLEQIPDWSLTRLAIGEGPAAPWFDIGWIDARPGDCLRLRILARDVALARDKPNGTSMRNMLAGTIATLEPVSASDVVAQVRLETGGQAPAPLLAARLTRLSAHELGLAPGVAVWCLVKGVATDARLIAPSPGGTPAGG